MTAKQFVLATSFIARMKGLLGTTRRTGEAMVLVLVPCKSIHTFGMHYSIDVAFIDKNGIVLKAKRGVLPRKTLKCNGAYMVLERASMPDAPWLSHGNMAPVSACIKASPEK